MLGIAILLIYQLIGYALHEFAQIPLPGNVIGLILLTLSLLAGWVKLAWIEQPAQFLLKHMMIFFAPTIVGTILFFSVIGQEWVSILVNLVVSTILVLLVTAWFTNRLSEKEEAR